MIEVRNECVSCGLPCISCGLQRVHVKVCDYCGEDVDTLYEYGGEQVCADCLLAEFEEVQDE